MKKYIRIANEGRTKSAEDGKSGKTGYPANKTTKITDLIENNNQINFYKDTSFAPKSVQVASLRKAWLKNMLRPYNGIFSKPKGCASFL